MQRREFLELLGSTAAGCCLPAALAADLPAAPAARPRDGLPPLYWSWWAWEPLDHYRRMNGVVGAVDAHAPWLPDWYNRIHSEELVRTMTGLGVNLAVTHFFKGFGLKHEHAEQQRTAELVRIAHRHGLRVLGYCQSRSLYYEAFLGEEPGAEDWIQRDQFGNKNTWGSSYFRWAPCVLSSEFRNYMKRVISYGLQEIGLDGLHFDNDYAYPCYCARCEKSFREWMAKNCPNARDRLGMDDYEHVRQPPQQASVSRIQDPLVQAWVRWRCETLGEYHRDLTDHARSVRPDVILLANPAHPRSQDSPYKRSVWAPMVGRHLTLMFAENSNCAGMVDGALVSQIRAYKQGEAIGYGVVSTTWRKDSATGIGLPREAADFQLQVAEAAAFRGVPGTNWGLRPNGEGAGMQIDRDDLREGFRRYMQFARGNEKLMAGARPVADVAVLQTFASQALDNVYAWPLVLGVEEVLIRAGFSWETVFGDDLKRMEQFGTLIVAGQSHLTDAECAALCAFAQRGGGLVLAGACGRYTETGRLRTADPFAGLTGARVVRLEDKAARSKVSTTSMHLVPLPKGHKEVAAGIAQALGRQWSARLSGSDTVAIAAYDLADGRRAVHLVNYAGKPVEGLKLALGPKWQAAEARLLTPDGPEQSLAVARGQAATLGLPLLDTYGVVVLSPG